MNEKKSDFSSTIPKWFLAIVSLGLIGFLVYRANLQPLQTQVGEIRVAAILNLTGPSSQFDAVKQQTLDVAIKRLAELKPNLDISLKIFDAGGAPESTRVAVSDAKKWGVQYYLSGTSPTALAIASQVRLESSPVVHLANAANPDFGPPRPGEYRFWPDWDHESELVFQIIQEQGIGSVLLIHSADPYSVALKNSLTKKLSTKDSIQQMEFQFDPASTPDFRPALLRAKQVGVDGLVVFGLPPGIRSLISQLKEVSWKESVIGGVNVNLAVKQFDESGLDCDLWLIETEAMKEELRKDGEAQKYRELYAKKYGETPPFHALYLADALYFMAEAYEKSDRNRFQLSDPVSLLGQVTAFEGPSGITFLEKDRTVRFEMGVHHARSSVVIPKQK